MTLQYEILSAKVHFFILFSLKHFIILEIKNAQTNECQLRADYWLALIILIFFLFFY